MSECVRLDGVIWNWEERVLLVPLEHVMKGEFVDELKKLVVLREERVILGNHSGDGQVACARSVGGLEGIRIFVQAHGAVITVTKVDGILLGVPPQVEMPLGLVTTQESSEKMDVRNATTSIEDAIDNVLVASDLVEQTRASVVDLVR